MAATSERDSATPHRALADDHKVCSPYLKIIEQPKQSGYRFRYRSEGNFWHGGLHGETSEKQHKVYPTVQLCGYDGRAAKVVLSLICVGDPVRPHANNLVGDNVARGECTLEINADVDWKAVFPNLGIFHVTKKDAARVLLERYALALVAGPEPVSESPDPKPGEELAGGARALAMLPKDDVAKLTEIADVQARTMNLSAVRLRFQAFLVDKSGRFTVPVPPCISQPVYDSRARFASTLKICKMNCHSGSVLGGDEVYMLCDRVQKDDIAVKFFDDIEQPDWEADAVFSLSDVHQQVAIVFKTPPYCNTSIDCPVSVWVALKRKSGTDISEPELFTYHPLQDYEEGGGGKRRKNILSEFIGSTSSFGTEKSASSSDMEVDVKPVAQPVATFPEIIKQQSPPCCKDRKESSQRSRLAPVAATSEGSSDTEANRKRIVQPSAPFVEAGAQRSPPTVKTLSEELIPYLPCQFTSSTIKEDGAALFLGNVSAKFPPSAMPLYSRVSMMVMNIKPDFEYDGKVFSPQVTIGPYCSCCLDSPVTLVLPLKVVGPVVVLMSRTTAGSGPDWEEVPSSYYVVHNDNVEMETVHCCTYQAQSGRPDTIVEPSFRHVYFSASVKQLHLTSTLLIRSSSDRIYCAERYGDYKFCHPPEKILKIRAVCGDVLRVSVKSMRNTIRQVTTPFNMESRPNRPLDEIFYIFVSPSGKEPGNRSVWLVLCTGNPPINPGESQSPPSTFPRPEPDIPFMWEIKANTEMYLDGEAVVRVQSHRFSSLEGCDESSTGCERCTKCFASKDVSGAVKYLPVDIHWMYPPEKLAMIASSFIRSTTPPQSADYDSDDISTEISDDSASLYFDEPDPAEQEWRKIKLTDSDTSARLFMELSDTSRPFSSCWKSIVQVLPQVSATAKKKGKATRRRYAFPEADDEIEDILRSVRKDHSENTNSECLRRALTKWLELSRGEVMVSDLLDVLYEIGLNEASKRLFSEFFIEHQKLCGLLQNEKASETVKMS